MSNANTTDEQRTDADRRRDRRENNDLPEGERRRRAAEEADFEPDWEPEVFDAPEDPVKRSIPGTDKEALVYIADEEAAEEVGLDDEESYDAIARLLGQHFVSPSYEHVTGADVRGWRFGTAKRLLATIGIALDGGDVDVTDAEGNR